jgi:hypothetical protein
MTLDVSGRYAGRTVFRLMFDERVLLSDANTKKENLSLIETPHLSKRSAATGSSRAARRAGM